MRRRRAQKRKVTPDPVFGSELVTRFVNRVMTSGKKSIAEKIVYDALDKAQSKIGHRIKQEGEAEADRGREGLSVLRAVLKKVSPDVEVRPRRVGGRTYQIPRPVSEERGITLAMAWVLKAAKKRGEKGMVERLAGELCDAFDGRGGAMKDRDTAHSMAKANQAFEHLT